MWQQDEVETIASCGSCGIHPGNIHRDLLTKFCEPLYTPAPRSITIPYIDTKSNTQVEDMTDTSIYFCLQIGFTGLLPIQSWSMSSRPLLVYIDYKTFGTGKISPMLGIMGSEISHIWGLVAYRFVYMATGLNFKREIRSWLYRLEGFCEKGPH